MIINSALITPRNVFMIIVMALVAIWLARKLIKHPATQPGGADVSMPDGEASTTGEAPQVNLG
jgi:fucose permease